MVIEGVREMLEVEAGPTLKQELLMTSPNKRPNSNVSTTFKEAVESIKESERGSQDRDTNFRRYRSEFF